MDRIVAYCGLVCSDCPSYIHTQSCNMEELERLASQAREEHGVADATAESVMCDGCLGDGRKIDYCAQCHVRACATSRGVSTCAACADYACATLEEFFKMVPDARATLDGLRASGPGATMDIDWESIGDARVRTFYALHRPLRRIIRDFYALLPEEHYDYRMVDRADRRSDSPRESLAHILRTQVIYVRGVQTGRLSFEDALTERYDGWGKDALLREMDRLDAELHAYLTGAEFRPDAPVHAPWGEMTAVEALYLIRDHDILHIGWNLAVMDHLGMERFPSLREYWG